jgi:hypothetical protein
MLDERAESTLCGVADLYIVDFGGGEQERARRESERDAERRRLADRCARYLAARAEMDQAAAHKVITALFDPRDGDGNECGPALVRLNSGKARSTATASIPRTRRLVADRARRTAYWSGDFDERDATLARPTLPGHRIRVEPGVGLIAGSVLEDEPESREWTDEDGTRWQEMNGPSPYQRPGERN